MGQRHGCKSGIEREVGRLSLQGKKYFLKFFTWLQTTQGWKKNKIEISLQDAIYQKTVI